MDILTNRCEKMIESSVEGFQYFKLKHSLSKENFKKRLIELQKPKIIQDENFVLIEPLPCRTTKVAEFNGLFGQTIGDDKQGSEYAFAFKRDQIEAKNVPLLFQNEGKITALVQARGFGKTHYLMSNSVAANRNNITIYIDCSIDTDKKEFKDPIFNISLRQELEKDTTKIAFNEEEVKKLFLLIFFTKVLFFISWYNLEAKRHAENLKDIDYSDFLRISMINNLEWDAYLKKPQEEIVAFFLKHKQQQDLDTIFSICCDKMIQISKETEKQVLFAFDEAFDCRYIIKEKNPNYWIFTSRTHPELKSNYNIYNALASAIMNLKDKHFLEQEFSVILPGLPYLLLVFFQQNCLLSRKKKYPFNLPKY